MKSHGKTHQTLRGKHVKTLAFFFLLLFACPCFGQYSTAPSIVPFAADPTGKTCSPSQIAVNGSNGYTCGCSRGVFAACGGGVPSGVSPIAITPGRAISLQNGASTPSNVTSAYGTGTAYFTVSGGASTQHDLIAGDANGGIADNGSGIQVTSGSSGTFKIAGISTTGNGLGVEQSVTSGTFATTSSTGQIGSTITVVSSPVTGWYDVAAIVEQTTLGVGCPSSAVAAVGLQLDFKTADGNQTIIGNTNMPLQEANSAQSTGMVANLPLACNTCSATSIGNAQMATSDRQIYVKSGTNITMVVNQGIATNLSTCSTFPAIVVRTKAVAF